MLCLEAIILSYSCHIMSKCYPTFILIFRLKHFYRDILRNVMGAVSKTMSHSLDCYSNEDVYLSLNKSFSETIVSNSWQKHYQLVLSQASKESLWLHQRVTSS